MNPDKKQVSSDVDASLQKVAFGTSIILIGSLISLVFSFLSRILIARIWTELELGIFALSYSILSICVAISTLGLKQGVVRNIAYSLAKKDYKKIFSFISSSIYFSLITSVIVAAVVFFIAEPLAINVFHEPGLVLPLRIFSLAIPFFALIEIIVSIFRGFDDIKPFVYFEYFLLGILFPVFIVLIYILDQSFENVFVAGTGTFVITFILLAAYSTSKISSKKVLKYKRITSPAAKELLFFSLPLLGTAMLQMIIIWTDTLMVGGILSASYAGLYSVSHNISQLISFPLGALLIMYIPVLSGLYAKKRFDEIKINYSIVTKWLCSITMPLFIFLFLFPESTIGFLYGSNYVFAADALRILSLGFIINNFAGPCGATLVSMGKSKFIMYATLSTAVLNIILNFILIPIFGIVGAAIASASSLFIINIAKLLKLYSLSGVQPVSKNLLKPTLITVLLILIPFWLFQKTTTVRWDILAILFASFYLIYLLVFLVSRSLDKEDLNLLNMIQTKPGGNIQKIKGFLSRFV